MTAAIVPFRPRASRETWLEREQALQIKALHDELWDLSSRYAWVCIRQHALVTYGILATVAAMWGWVR